MDITFSKDAMVSIEVDGDLFLRDVSVPPDSDR
jgi:hypothetical protein